MASHSFLFSFFLVLVIANSCLPGEGRSPLCHNQERLTLVQFAYSFIVDCSQSRKPPFRLLDKMTWTIQPAFDSIPTHPKVVSWASLDDESVSDCCGWDGVECEKDTSHVVGLDLSRSCLFGKFPTNSSVFRLVHLQKLSLANNRFDFSPIPDGFSYLSRLTYLNPSYTLSFLDLSYNVDPFDDEKPLLQLSSNSYSLESLVHNMTA
ncbi:hypothetical protein Cgig2_013983 [Carnegiea gigantea]|uniref:Leucine-rich repeat-containing N-terminal plant-type domain-containing protein n=1 Tax=Carnegiea gigantea TaxID=171969 RepID=A0A9Q1KUM3_9CARY|nr:hypothetical protein Cgig2_013983 [Carnegiea gigantea]